MCICGYMIGQHSMTLGCASGKVESGSTSCRLAAVFFFAEPYAVLPLTLPPFKLRGGAIFHALLDLV